MRREKALISVSNKDKVVEFAKNLNERGIEVIATEGTAKEISTHGVSVTKVSAFTGSPEMLDGKVKTLHPKIHAAIITAEIGIVAVNLIPLHPNSIENMDIGGVALLRSAIKNFENVSVIVNPGRYDEIVKELRKEGNILYETKLNLAIEASEYILGYELKINELLKGKRE